MKSLNFGYDTNLLLHEDENNEGQYRQLRYCQLLDIRRAMVVMTHSTEGYAEQRLFSGNIWVVRARGRWAWLRIWRAFQLGLRISRQFAPHFVEYQDPMIAGVAAFLVAGRLGVPLIGAVFNDFIDNPIWLRQHPSHHLYNRMGKFVLAHSKQVRCDSHETARRLKSAGFEQVEYIPFFIPWLERFAVSSDVQQARLQRWRDDPAILCVARLAPEKNVALLLRAFAQVYHATARGRLLIIGSGPLEKLLKELAVQLKIQDRTEWLGVKGYLSLPAYYRSVNIFALSSDSETSARVLILAQASRLPTVTTDTSGSQEIVDDGDTGYTTRVGEVGSFARALGRLLSDEQLYRRMLESGSYSALEKYGEAGITGPLRAFYEKVLW